MKEQIIIDTDWGGDALQLMSVLLAHPERFDIAAATTVFGNTSHDYALQNCGDILHMLHADHIPYYPGADKPSDRDVGPGDGAHGQNGIGGVLLDHTPIPPQSERACDIIPEILIQAPERTVSLIAVGPQTNNSIAFQQIPDAMKRVKQILIMGGCTAEMNAVDMPLRKGNIEANAEFNFNQAPHDADIILNSGLPIILFPMNCTHQMTVTPEREDMIRQSFSHTPDLMEKVVRLMTAPAEIDMQKFGISPVMHDVHTALYLLHPDQYVGRRGCITVGSNGRTDFKADPNGNVLSMDTVKNPDLLFQTVLHSLSARLMPQPEPHPFSLET